MLKDLLHTLQQGTQQIAAEQQLSNEALASMIAPTLNNNGSGRGGSRQHGHHGSNNPPVGNFKGMGSRAKAFMQAISAQESGGNYGAVGVPTSSGTALGKYQVLDTNIKGPSGWDQRVLGRNITPTKFLHSPKLQEKIVRGVLLNYFKQYGARGAAKAWYAGPGNANTNSDAPQYGGPSINSYADSVLNHMKDYLS